MVIESFEPIAVFRKGVDGSYLVFCPEVDGVFTPRLPLVRIMESSHRSNQHIADLIFPGAGNQPRVTTDTRNIIMSWVLMAYRDNTRLLLSQGITQVGRIGVSDNDALVTLDQKT